MMMTASMTQRKRYIYADACLIFPEQTDQTHLRDDRADLIRMNYGETDRYL